MLYSCNFMIKVSWILLDKEVKISYMVCVLSFSRKFFRYWSCLLRPQRPSLWRCFTTRVGMSARKSPPLHGHSYTWWVVWMNGRRVTTLEALFVLCQSRSIQYVLVVFLKMWLITDLSLGQCHNNLHTHAVWQGCVVTASHLYVNTFCTFASEIS